VVYAAVAAKEKTMTSGICCLIGSYNGSMT